jgi:hypothetical protein
MLALARWDSGVERSTDTGNTIRAARECINHGIESLGTDTLTTVMSPQLAT